MFIVVDGIDGSGKGTIVDAMAAALDRAGKRVFDLRAYAKRQRTLPAAKDLKKYDAIVSAEPTHAWIGAAIREEIVRSDEYPGESFADAFALDREVLHRRLIIPLRKAGKIILQERGVSTTLAYQTLQGVSVREILRKPGNALALRHSPDALVLAILKPEAALRRIAGRTGKRDKAIFEKRAFLTKLARRYSSPSYRRLFTARGTRVINFDTSDSMKIMQRKAVLLLQDILARKH